MNFDYTYIYLFGFVFYEPMVVLTNTIFFLFALFFFKKLITFKSSYAKQMASFLLLLGASSFFGAIGHTVHYQLSKTFFDLILLVMNATSLFAVYFLFRASYSYDNHDKVVSPFFNNVILVWISVMLYVSWLQADFTLIKIHAAAILIYALFAHYRVYIKTKEKGNEMLIFGILVSFLPILVHSMHISFGVWFNHKDLAHLFMIISLCIIYSGTLINVRAIEAKVMA